MPTRSVWVDPELFLEQKSVKVFHTYTDDDVDQGHTHYLFTLNPKCGAEESRCEYDTCPHVFDVRDLSTWQPPEQPSFCTGTNDTPANRTAWKQYWKQEEAAIRTSISSAIHTGELTTAGRRSGDRPPDSH